MGNKNFIIAIWTLATLLLIAAAVMFWPKSQKASTPTAPTATAAQAPPQPKPAQVSPPTAPTPAPSSALVAEPLVAQSEPTTADPETEKAICDTSAQLARSVMAARQRGASLQEMMSIDLFNDQSAHSGLAKQIAIAAYKQPRFSTPEYVDKAIQDFENDIYVTCLEARSGN